jgi:hypothetical protein
MTLSTDNQIDSRFNSVSLLPLKPRNQRAFEGSAFHFCETVAFHFSETLSEKMGIDYQSINPTMLKQMKRFETQLKVFKMQYINTLWCSVSLFSVSRIRTEVLNGSKTLKNSEYESSHAQ